MTRTHHEQAISEPSSREASAGAHLASEKPPATQRNLRLKIRRGFTVLSAIVLLTLMGLATLSAVGGDHTLRSVTYAQTPPHSGNHSPVWQKCGFYSAPVGNEHAVHSLEHGVVWITFHPDLPQTQVDDLRELARAQDNVIVSPYPNLPAPVVVSAWQQQARLDGAGDPRLVQLVGEYRNSPLAPEPGGGCDGPNMWFSGSTGNPER